MRNKTLMIMGITGIIFTISTFFYVFAIETAGTVSGSLAMGTYPLFSIFMEFLIFRKKRRTIEIFFTITIIVGIYYLGTEGTWLISDFSIWFGLALIVPFLWSIAHVIIKNSIDTSPITPSQITFIRVLIASIVLFVISSLVNSTSKVLEGLMNPEFQFIGFLMGIVYYVELINWFYAVKHIEVSVASTITTPAPLITIFFALLLLKEPIGFYHVIAMIIIFASLYGLLWAGNRKKNIAMV